MPKHPIWIETRGGCVVSVYVWTPLAKSVDVRLLDHDLADGDEEDCREYDRTKAAFKAQRADLTECA